MKKFRYKGATYWYKALAIVAAFAVSIVYIVTSFAPAWADDAHSWTAPDLTVPSSAEGFDAAPTGTLTIENTGTAQISNITATLSGANADVFELGTCATSISAPRTFFGMKIGGTGTCQVKGKVGTPVGVYNATLELNGDDTDPLTVNVTWQVSSPLNITVENGTSSAATAPAGGKVTITSGAAPEGQEFDHWEIVSGGASIDNASSSSAALTLGSEDAVVKAVFRDVPQPNPPYYSPVFQVVENQCVNPMQSDRAIVTCWTDNGKDFYVRLEVTHPNLQESTSVTVQDTTALHYLGGTDVPGKYRSIPIDGKMPNGHPYVVLQADNWTTQGQGVNFMPKDYGIQITHLVNRGTDEEPIASGHNKQRDTQQEFFHPLSQALSYSSSDDNKVTLTMKTEDPATIEKLGTIEIFPVDENYQWRGDKQYDDADLDGYERGGMECSIGNTDPNGCNIEIDASTGEAKVTFPRQDGWDRIQYITWMTDTNAVDPFKTYTMRPYQGQIPLPSVGKVKVEKIVDGDTAFAPADDYEYSGTLSYDAGSEHQEYDVTDDSWSGKEWKGEEDFDFDGDSTEWKAVKGGASQTWEVPTGAKVNVTENNLPVIEDVLWGVKLDDPVTVVRGQTHTLKVTNTLKLTLKPPVGTPDETWGPKNTEQTGTPSFEVSTLKTRTGGENKIEKITLLDVSGVEVDEVKVEGGTYHLNDDGMITFTPDTDYVGDPKPVDVRGYDGNGEKAETTYTVHIKENGATKTVKRTVTYTYITEDGEKVQEDVVQEVTFSMELDVDPSTGEVGEPDWSKAEPKEFPALTSPDITADGWVTEHVVVAAAVVKATDEDMIEHVVYQEKKKESPTPTPSESAASTPSASPSTPGGSSVSTDIPHQSIASHGPHGQSDGGVTKLEQTGTSVGLYLGLAMSAVVVGVGALLVRRRYVQGS
ncbi:MAG: hypothetical protein J6M18_05105 [Actinomycetaceae bacterium]|nr:hypothetical protein [Actinomycetaceae bacterium]